MEFRLNIRTNDMSETDLDKEIARILRATADQIERGASYYFASVTILDFDGYDVGRFVLNNS